MQEKRKRREEIERTRKEIRTDDKEGDMKKGKQETKTKERIWKEYGKNKVKKEEEED